MPFGDLTVNGISLPISRYTFNSLLPEACKRFDLEGVDFDIVHTDLDALPRDATSAPVYGLARIIHEARKDEVAGVI